MKAGGNLKSSKIPLKSILSRSHYQQDAFFSCSQRTAVFNGRGGGQRKLKKRVRFQLPEEKQKDIVHTSEATSSFTNYDYKTVMASAEVTSEQPMNNIPTPVCLHIGNTLARASKNWIMWSTWDSEILDFPATDMSMSKVDLLTKINYTAKQNFLEKMGWEPLRDTTFIVIKVTQENIEECYYQSTHEIQISAQQLSLVDDNRKPAGKPVPIKVLACGGLAEILQVTVNYGDILIISGGEDLIGFRKNSTVPLVHLNINKEWQTKIFRVVDIPKNLYGRIILFEKIEPLSEKTRYKFSYVSRHGSSRREMKLYRTFTYDQFCRDVRDTLAYSRSRRDFSVPLNSGTYNVLSLYRLLSSPELRIPSTTSHPYTLTKDIPKEKTNFSSDDEDDSYYCKPPTKKWKQKRSHSSIHDTTSNAGNFPQKRVVLAQGDTELWKLQKSSESHHICRRLLSCLLLTVFLSMMVFGLLIITIKYLSSNADSQSDSCPVHFWSNNKGIGLNLETDLKRSRRQPIQPTDVMSVTPINKNQIKLEKIISTGTWDHGKYYYNRAYDSISWWFGTKAATVMQWLDIVIEWINENCNLQCVLSKLGFDVDVVGEAIFVFHN